MDQFAGVSGILMGPSNKDFGNYLRSPEARAIMRTHRVAYPPEVTLFPNNPPHGLEVYYRPNSALRYLWHYRYDAVVGQWVFLGGDGSFASVYDNTGTVSIANSAVSSIPTNTVRYDPDGLWTSSPNWFTIKVPGIYQVSFTVLWPAIATADTYVESFVVYNSGPQRIPGCEQASISRNALAGVRQSGSGSVRLFAGDTLNLGGFQNSGAAVTLPAFNGTINNELTVKWIAP